VPAIEELRGCSFQPPGGHLWPWLLVAVLLVALSIWVYRRNPAPISGPMRALLQGIRALAFLVLLVLICRPVITMGAADKGRRRRSLASFQSLFFPPRGFQTSGFLHPP